MSAVSHEEIVRPSPLELAAWLPYVCLQMQAPFTVRVVTVVEEEYISRADEKMKRLKSTKSTTTVTRETPTTTQREPSLASNDAASYDGEGSGRDERDDVTVQAACDAAGRYAALALRAPRLPRLLLQLLRLSLPLHPALARLSVRVAPLDGVLVYELDKVLRLAHVTELRLDDSPAAHRCFHTLLDARTPLRLLSLARCSLDDCDCELIAARLTPPAPAAQSLALLSLAGNALTDAAAGALGAALRANRSLLHLDLADNRIGDAGAAALLASLDEFPLTREEQEGKRRRRLQHLRQGMSLAALTSSLRGCVSEERGDRRRRTQRRSRSAGLSQVSSEHAPRPPADPFGAEHTAVRGGRLVSRGNTTLCSLNLAYNELGWASAVRLRALLERQQERRVLAQRTSRSKAPGVLGTATGLLRVVLEGNPMPVSEDLIAVDELLETNLKLTRSIIDNFGFRPRR